MSRRPAAPPYDTPRATSSRIIVVLLSGRPAGVGGLAASLAVPGHGPGLHRPVRAPQLPVPGLARRPVQQRGDTGQGGPHCGDLPPAGRVDAAQPEATDDRASPPSTREAVHGGRARPGHRRDASQRLPVVEAARCVSGPGRPSLRPCPLSAPSLSVPANERSSVGLSLPTGHDNTTVASQQRRGRFHRFGVCPLDLRFPRIPRESTTGEQWSRIFGGP